jgi:hypothetical protein
MKEVKTIADLLLSGPTDENAAREKDENAELLKEVEKLRERVQVLEVIVQEIKYLIVKH